MDFTRPVEAVIPGARGRLLGVLARTTDPLSLRSLAELAGVSAAQAARIVPDLVLLGIVERREAPPASLVWLASGNLAADLIRRLADIRTELLEGLRRTAAEIRPAPVSLVLFGSFARGDASAESDLDVLAVRPRSVPEGDDGWTSALAGWTDRARRLSGNTVNLVEVGQEELRNLLRRPTTLWREITGDGILLFGSPLVEREVGHGG